MIVGKKGMLIRKPAAEVFGAFADPAVTTHFWFSKSTGKLTQGAQVTWTWEWFGASAPVSVKQVEESQRLVFEWGPPGKARTVELRFAPAAEGTYVQVTETGYQGSADEQAAAAVDSIAGFALVLAAAKAWLEHGIELNVVRDHAPIGVQL